MKTLFKISAGLIAISLLISGYLFYYPTPESFMPHWVLPVFSIICFVILIGADRGPKPKHKERGFGAILICMPLLAILFQLHYLAENLSVLLMFKSELVPILGFHAFLATVGNYVTTSKSLLSGLPTPWNLRSDLSWSKSHRMIGYGFVGLAIISGLTTLIKGQYDHNVLGAGLIILLVSFAIYSWWVWRNDPNRGPLHGRG